jgi:hypothetical protein
MIMYVLSLKLIEKLKIQAGQTTVYDDSEPDLYGLCGGNYDDAYSIGHLDGETSLARMILTSFYVDPINVEVPDNAEEEKKMAKETVAQRRARETRTREADDRYMLWEAEKPMRLLRALARANDLEVEARVYYRADNILYYEFDFGGYTHYSDPVVELGESTMDLIDLELDSIEAKRVKERRLRQVKEELLARLTNEEREALGL